jgi:hypothetical protein
MNTYPIDPRLTSEGVFSALNNSKKPVREWGKARNGAPILSARTGGDKQPAILIAAGAHSDETAGVHAALSLLNFFESRHELHILPLRDPFGFNGINHCLTIAGGQKVEAASHLEVLDYLKTNARLIWSEESSFIFLLGEIGFVWRPHAQGLESFWSMFNLLSRLSRQRQKELEPLLGKSLMLIDASASFEGAGEMQRCWHGIWSKQGEWLHLNRFFGRDDAPLETFALDRLIQEIRPGLVVDLHEGNGSGFWLPIPKPRENIERSIAMAQAFFNYIQSRGYPITSYDEWLSTDQTGASDMSWMLPEPEVPGLFWTKSSAKGEGPNLMEYADMIGVGFGTEAPMEQSISIRVDGLVHGTAAAIRVWEESLGRGCSV